VFETTAHATILVVVQVAVVVVLAYLIRAAYEARAARKHELSKLILDKMSSEEFLRLLESPDGGRSIERLLGNHKTADEWVTDALRRAIFLILAGIAGVIVYLVTDYSGREITLILGSLFVAVGVGYLIAAALTRSRARSHDIDSTA